MRESGRVVYFESQSEPTSSGSLVRIERGRGRDAQKMDAPLSAYWVKFFKNAGFPMDVATRHAVIFSNNRIKPDMLPDLDKPSLKEMGITLMGDMIAILRYAKNVVEETTCKKFLVNSEDSPSPVKTAAKPVVKKIMTKTVTKTPTTTKVKLETPMKIIKSASSSINKPSLTIKKKLSPITQTSRLYSDYIDTTQRPKVNSLKRKYDSDDDIDGKWVHNDTSSKRSKTNDDDVKYKVIMPKGTTIRSQKILKKALEQKRTVFHRLGDSMVSSTTSITESSNSSFTPTFNVTGVGSDMFKRNSSVFNRLGNKDSEKHENMYTSHLRSGGASSGTQGILKTRTPLLGTKIITTKSTLKKPVGTMRADEEASKKATQSIKVIRTTKTLKFSDSPIRSSSSSFARKLPITGKLASERVEVPAKFRLGVSKQVTFNKMATVNHIKKQGVFSRLGV